jgi:hypothetical protein
MHRSSDDERLLLYYKAAQEPTRRSRNIADTGNTKTRNAIFSPPPSRGTLLAVCFMACVLTARTTMDTFHYFTKKCARVRRDQAHLLLVLVDRVATLEAPQLLVNW